MSFSQIVTPGAFVPAVPSKGYQLKRISERVKASQAVVDLLCELAFGSPHEWVDLHLPIRAPEPFMEGHRHG